MSIKANEPPKLPDTIFLSNKESMKISFSSDHIITFLAIINIQASLLSLFLNNTVIHKITTFLSSIHCIIFGVIFKHCLQVCFFFTLLCLCIMSFETLITKTIHNLPYFVLKPGFLFFNEFERLLHVTAHILVSDQICYFVHTP